tara:strand:+ start:413 stop:652 length:240 start_codon:yes stop_codon:yes gene_type:complete
MSNATMKTIVEQIRKVEQMTVMAEEVIASLNKVSPTSLATQNDDIEEAGACLGNGVCSLEEVSKLLGEAVEQLNEATGF